jgi:hypothetical protein
LIRAAERFDPRSGTLSSTFAARCIEQAIRDALIRPASTIRLPARMGRLVSQWPRAVRALGCELGRVLLVMESMGTTDCLEAPRTGTRADQRSEHPAGGSLVRGQG